MLPTSTQLPHCAYMGEKYTFPFPSQVYYSSSCFKLLDYCSNSGYGHIYILIYLLNYLSDLICVLPNFPQVGESGLFVTSYLNPCETFR